MTAIAYFWRRYWVWVAVLVFISLAVMGGSVITPDANTKQLEETNRQLKRIADSLEIISGQRSGWKIPK